MQPAGSSGHEHIHWPKSTFEHARKLGHTGVIFKNVIDDYHAQGKPSDVHVVFDAKNIRHVNAKFENLDSRNIFD